MTMTDPIADFLTRLRNANSAHHDTVSIPFSKLKSHIAEILQAEGYIQGWKVEDAPPVGKNLVVELKYGPNRERALAGVKRVSKPGLRVYAKSTNLQGARRPRRGDPVHVLRPAHRQAGSQEGRGWGKSSPTSGDLRPGKEPSHVSYRQDSRPGPGWGGGRQHRRRRRHGEGPEGHPHAHGRVAHRGQAGGGHARRDPS